MNNQSGYKFKKFKRFSSIEGKPGKSSHDVSMAMKSPKKDLGLSVDKKEYFLKPYSNLHVKLHVYEVEAFSSEIYRFLLGNDRAPKVRVLVDENNEVYGTVSKKIHNYKSFYDVIREKNKRIPNKRLIKAGFGSLIAASYIMEERDLHGGNYGFNHEGKLSRIDFDQNLLPLVSNRIKRDIPSVETLNNLLTHKLEEGNNPLKDAFKFENQEAGLAVMETKEEFRFDKWKTFIKLCLLKEENIKAMLYPHIKEEKQLNYATRYVYKRAESIKKQLLKSEDFRMIFLKYSKNMMDSIKKEISDYNHDFKSKHPDREVPIHEAEFNKLLKDVYVESLKEQLYKASAFLKLQTEEASIFNQEEVKELKEISQALDEKLKGIDFSKIDNSTDLISDVSKQLNTASAFMSKFNLLDKVTVFLKAVSEGETLPKAFNIAFKNPRVLNKLTNTIMADLEVLNEQSRHFAP
ncbi:MAG: hypothetical protein LEGION0398_MBIBDBAK_01356 [Legionellaceae bacterium]